MTAAARAESSWQKNEAASSFCPFAPYWHTQWQSGTVTSWPWTGSHKPVQFICLYALAPSVLSNLNSSNKRVYGNYVEGYFQADLKLISTVKPLAAGNLKSCVAEASKSVIAVSSFCSSVSGSWTDLWNMNQILIRTRIIFTFVNLTWRLLKRLIMQCPGQQPMHSGQPV